MAELFIKQAAFYAGIRPAYPPELFPFIASKTPNHDLAWDIGTGNGQAAVPLASLFKDVVGTDTSPTQLVHAQRLPNIRYQQAPSSMTLDELTHLVAPESSVDLVTVAQAMLWFDLPTFYQQVMHVLNRPGGVLAAWGHTETCQWHCGCCYFASASALNSQFNCNWYCNIKGIPESFSS